MQLVQLLDMLFVLFHQVLLQVTVQQLRDWLPNSDLKLDPRAFGLYAQECDQILVDALADRGGEWHDQPFPICRDSSSSSMRGKGS